MNRDDFDDSEANARAVKRAKHLFDAAIAALERETPDKDTAPLVLLAGMLVEHLATTDLAWLPPRDAIDRVVRFVRDGARIIHKRKRAGRWTA